MSSIPVALTIAGSDSGGGAGIQADLKTFFRFNVFGTSAITAITAQNTLGVTDWEPVSGKLVKEQIDAVFEDLHPAAIKTGMIGSPDVCTIVVESIIKHRPAYVVVDPVMVATSGDILLESGAVNIIREKLIPLAHLVTPNLDEVKVLTGETPSNVDEMKLSAHRIVHELGAKAALVKGGHLTGPTVPDVFYDGSEYSIFENPRLDSTNVHGTGCTLSAAIAANLALGHDMHDSVSIATNYVHNAILTAPGLGSGHGPLNHFFLAESTDLV